MWGLVAIGCSILLLGIDQPLLLLVISACVGGTMMFLYSMLLLLLNRQQLPKVIQVRSIRVAVLLWSTAFFGVLAAVIICAAADRAIYAVTFDGEARMHDVDVSN